MHETEKKSKTIAESKSELSPEMVVDTSDPGDAMQHNVAYQHAYGVGMLVGLLAGLPEFPYSTIWCEHHDDYLTQRTDGFWIAHQVKTSTPEHGYWEIHDRQLEASLARFTRLQRRFPNLVVEFRFASNVEIFDTNSIALDKIKKSPIKLVAAVKNAPALSSLVQPFGLVLEGLASRMELEPMPSPEELFDLLKRVSFVKGAPREAFPAVLSHEMLPRLTECADLEPHRLDGLRDHLMEKVRGASSILNSDAARYWCCLDGSDGTHPDLQAKRIAVEDCSAWVRDFLEHPAPFSLLGPSQALTLPQTESQMAVVAAKLNHAGLADQVGTMQTRALAAERHLMSIVQKLGWDEERIEHLANLVKGECDEAALEARTAQGPVGYGPLMMVKLLARLRGLSKDRAYLAFNREPEVLIGVAGLLTGECQVWWSEPFDLEEAV